jgi:hypothetical protein
VVAADTLDQSIPLLSSTINSALYPFTSSSNRQGEVNPATPATSVVCPNSIRVFKTALPGGVSESILLSRQPIEPDKMNLIERGRSNTLLKVTHPSTYPSTHSPVHLSIQHPPTHPSTHSAIRPIHPTNPPPTQLHTQQLPNIRPTSIQ